MTLTDMRLTDFMGLTEKKCYDKALYLVNNRHDFKGMHDLQGNFPYDDFSVKLMHDCIKVFLGAKMALFGSQIAN